jgi:hypothetical protein
MSPADGAKEPVVSRALLRAAIPRRAFVAVPDAVRALHFGASTSLLPGVPAATEA